MEGNKPDTGGPCHHQQINTRVRGHTSLRNITSNRQMDIRLFLKDGNGSEKNIKLDSNDKNTTFSNNMILEDPVPSWSMVWEECCKKYFIFWLSQKYITKNCSTCYLLWPINLSGQISASTTKIYKNYCWKCIPQKNSVMHKFSNPNLNKFAYHSKISLT